jgi:hypothetical protein
MIRMKVDIKRLTRHRVTIICPECGHDIILNISGRYPKQTLFRILPDGRVFPNVVCMHRENESYCQFHSPVKVDIKGR